MVVVVGDRNWAAEVNLETANLLETDSEEEEVVDSRVGGEEGVAVAEEGS